MTTTEPARHTVAIVPGLHAIQHEFGYLQREALEAFSQKSGIPLHRLQSVASFFPHFRLSPPHRVTLRVCRDMSCHLAGSGELLREFGAKADDHLAVEGASCMGRCDRAPAACVSVTGLAGHAGEERERYLHGRSPEQLREAVAACLTGDPPESDLDLAYRSEPTPGRIDPYSDGTPSYAAISHAITARDSALRVAIEKLTQMNWDPWRMEQFRVAATRHLEVPFTPSQSIIDAVDAWLTESDWAAGPMLGGWSECVLDEIKAADLRGMGGAGIPAVQKWRDVRDAVRTARKRKDDPRAYIVVNGDESEPGTFKDRELLLQRPHLVVEGVLLAGLVTEATEGFIFIRHEYPEQIAACELEIRRAEQLGLCGPNPTKFGRPFPISVFTSPGGYICGEQSALIEAMSDRRGEPRNMPPKLETNGLNDRPTLVSNVETFAWAPYIVVHGGEAYAAEGVHTWKGRRIFSISGDVQRPGVYEVPMGLQLRDLIYGTDYCQGMAGGAELKAFAPSGPSGGFLPRMLTAPGGLPRNLAKSEVWKAFAARHSLDVSATAVDILDLELELNLFRAISPTQALGAGIVVYSQERNMAAQAVNSLEFYRNESCGKCVPCRLGSQKLATLGSNLLAGAITTSQWDTELTPLLTELCRAIELSSICGLGRSVPMPLRTAINFFPEDLAAFLKP